MASPGDGVPTSSGIEHEGWSDEVRPENQCDQCSDSGLTVNASGFCTECNDYLCSTCINLHMKLRGLKNHTVWTGKNMPRVKPRDTGAEHCLKHPAEPITMYCVSENVLGCVRCFTTEHRSCKDVGLITDLSKDVETSKELNQVESLAQRHTNKIELYRKLIAEYHLINNNCYERSLKDFESFRSDIEETLDSLSEAVSAASQDLKDANEKKLDQLSRDVIALDKDIVCLVSDIEVKQKLKQKDQLFIAVMKNLKPIQDLMQKHIHLRKDINIHSYQFEADPDLKQLLNTMVNSDDKMKVLAGDISLGSDINVKTYDDKEDCSINGMVHVSPSELLITDLDNQSLKLVDVDRGTIVKRRALTSPPRDITVVPEAQVAVALPLVKQIHFFSGDKNLDPCGSLDIDGECLAVRSLEDQLVVSYRNPPKVQIMNLQGHVLKSFSSDSAGNQLFDYPRFLSVSPRETSTYIFVSDKKRNSVTCLTTDGNVEWIYKDEDLECPMGLATSTDGCIYVCSCDTDSTHVVSVGGVRLRVLPFDTVKFPVAISFNRDMGVMYVSSSSTDPKQGNVIRRFDLQ